MSVLTKLNEYAEMQQMKSDLNKLRTDNREKWDTSGDPTSARLLLATIRTRIAIGRFELMGHIKTGQPPKIGLLEK